MAKKSSKAQDFFKGIAQPESPDVQDQEVRTELRTRLKKLRKTGRPKTFKEETDRLTVDIPIETLIKLKQYLPVSPYKTLSHIVNTALVQFLENEKDNRINL